MHWLRSLMAAFSIYSKIPVPQIQWNEEDMKDTLCFFPWVGGVVGGCVYLWSWLCSVFQVGELCRALAGAAIPLIITGGFHADGFMDTMDAFHSYQPRDRKLEILKDSHIGAFAVIMLAVYGMVYVAAFSEVADMRLLRIVCGGFFLSRCLSGLSVVSFPLAKKQGMAAFFADRSRKGPVRNWLIFQGLGCVGFMLLQSVWMGGIAAAAALVWFACYYYQTKKELGGITGDTAGYFLLVCELVIVAAAAAVDVAAV